MAKDPFQDIVPPGEHPRPTSAPLSPSRPTRLEIAEVPPSQEGEKSVRNIHISRRIPPPARMPQLPLRGRRRGWLWILAACCAFALLIIGILIVFRKTVVNVVPHSQTVTFDQTAQFTAYPYPSAASGTISYTVEHTDFEDSATVSANGIMHKDEKAEGSITVFNDYSSSPLKLIKNTRFATISGLIFRAPADIVVPAKGAAPGKVVITVVADKAGAAYNIGPNVKLTLPGLQTNTAMYASVYAQTAASTTGGFSGDVPAVDPATLSAAQSAMRARIQAKVAQFTASINDGISLQPRITYTDGQPVSQGGTLVIGENAHVAVPVVSQTALAAAIAQTTAAAADSPGYSLVPESNFAATMSDSSANVGQDPIPFTLGGAATLVAVVDQASLAAALAGRGADSFQAIVSNFPGVQSAHARIEPFWESTFPTDPKDIHIVISPPGGTNH